MYAALWRRIPGGLPGKIAGILGLLLSTLAFLFFVLFPWVEPRLPWSDVTVDTPAVQTVVVTPSPSATVSPSAISSAK